MQTKCTKHNRPDFPKDKFVYFCVKRSCQKRLVCRECEYSIHKNHDLIHMCEFKEYYKPNEISEYNQNINNIVKVTKDMQTMLTHVCTNVQKSFTKVQINPHLVSNQLTDDIMDLIVHTQDEQRRKILDQIWKTLQQQSEILKELVASSDQNKIKKQLEVENKIKSQCVQSNWGAISLQDPIQIDVSHDMRSLAISADGKYIVSAGGEDYKKIVISDPKIKENVGKLKAYEHDWLISVSYSQCGKYIVSGGGDQTVRQWKVSTQEQIGQPMYHKGVVYGAQYTSDGKHIVSMADDKTVRVWDAKTCKEDIDKRIISKFSIHRFNLSPSKTEFAIAGSKGEIQIWNYKQHRMVGQNLIGNNCWSQSLQFSNNGKMLVSGGEDGKIYVWDLIRRRKIRSFKHGKGNIADLRFSTDMKYILLAGYPQSRIFNTITGEEIFKHNLSSGSKGSFSVDGKYIIIGQFRGTLLIYQM